MLLTMLLLAVSSQVSSGDLAQTAIEAAKANTQAQLIRPYLFEGAIVVETPFLRVAIQARDAMDRYLPFSASDVAQASLAPVVTISAHDNERSFKHLVIAIPAPGASPPEPVPVPPEPPPPAPPPGKKKIDIDTIVKHKVARANWRQAMDRRDEEIDRREKEYRATMTILQPTAIEATEHVWQNAFSATFKTAGVKATFPMDALAAGREIRAVLNDGSEITVALTPRVMARLR